SLREIVDSTDEGTAGLAELGFQRLIQPPLRHDGGERLSACFADGANRPAGAIVVGRRNEQTRARPQGVDDAPGGQVTSCLSSIAIPMEHAFLLQLRQNAPNSVQGPEDPRMRNGSGRRNLQQQDVVYAAP